MGVSIHLCWTVNGKEEWLYVFKLSSYPYQLEDYDIPEEDGLPSKLDPKYLNDYLEWLKKLQFFMKFAPEKYMEIQRTSNSIETLKESVLEDITNTLEVINKSKQLDLKKIKNWLSVG